MRDLIHLRMYLIQAIILWYELKLMYYTLVGGIVWDISY